MWNTIPEPMGWPSVKTTYDSTLRQKLATAPAAVTKDVKLAAIDYWIQRLLQDKNSICLGAPLVP